MMNIRLQKTAKAAAAALLSLSLLSQPVLPSVTASTLASASTAATAATVFTYDEQEQESNNLTTETGQPYQLTGSETFRYTGTISGKTDQYDFHPFRVEKSGYMNVKLFEEGTPKIMNLDIVDLAENELDDNYETVSSVQENVYLEAGNDYFVRAALSYSYFNQDISHDYRIEGSFTPQPVITVDPRTTAQAVTLGETINGIISAAKGEAWYTFTPDANYAATISVTPDAGSTSSFAYQLYDGAAVVAGGTPLILKQGMKYDLKITELKGEANQAFTLTLTQTAKVDEYEANDEHNRASITSLGLHASDQISATLHSAADVDWYQMKLGQSGVFDVGLASLPTGVNYYFKVYNEHFTLLADSENYAEKLIRNLPGTQNQMFYVKVYSKLGFHVTDSYELYTRSFRAAPGSDTEPNDRLEDAAPPIAVTLNEVLGGSLSEAGDQDWYTFQLAEGGRFEVEMFNFPSDDHRMDLYDKNRNPLYLSENNDMDPTNKLITGVSGAKGDLFYVHVYSVSRDQENFPAYEDYEIEIRMVGGDQYEVNNTRETAVSNYVTKLGRANESSVQGTIHEAADVDWYQLSPYTTGYFSVSIPVLSDKYRIDLYDAALQPVGNRWSDGTITDIFGKKDTAFYLKVSSKNGYSSNLHYYDIKVKLEQTGLETKENEINTNNDTTDVATNIPLGHDMLGMFHWNRDTDYYKLDLTGRKGTVWVALENKQPTWHFSIYDQNKNFIGASEGTGGVNGIVMVPFTEGVYYIQVYQETGLLNYHLNVPYRLKTIIRDMDSFENNNTFFSATEASVYPNKIIQIPGYPNQREFKGTIHSISDGDFYKVSNTGLPYDLQISVDRYDVWVLDGDGREISSSVKEGRNFSVIIPKNKTYYVKVASRDGSYDMWNYTLNIKCGGIVPILIVPGFGGTSLFHYNNEGEMENVWMNYNVSDTARHMLQSPSGEPDDVFFKDQNGGLWGISDIAPESEMLGQDKYFDLMIEDLRAEGYTSGNTLFGVPYYFIRDNTEAAGLLKRKIDQAISKTGSSKVMLISHSNGGLIVKEAMMDPNYAKKTGKWITMGTPWLGAPASLKSWIDGYDLDIPILSNSVGRQLAMHSPSAYGLIPSPGYFHTSNYMPVLTYLQKNSDERNDHRFVNIDSYAKMKDFLSRVNHGQDYPYLDFNEELMNRALSKHQSYYDAPLTDVPFYNISGYGMNTIGSYRYTHSVWDVAELADLDKLPILDESAVPVYVSGDGTVPLNSSRGRGTFGIGTKKMRTYSITGVEHMPLVRDNRNRQQVKQILIYGNEVPVAGITMPASTDGFLNDTTAYNTDGVTATVLSVPLTGEEASLTLTQQNGEKTVIKTRKDKTFEAEQKSAAVTVDKLGNRLWITVPADQETDIAWTGAEQAELKVYDMKNSEYKTSYKVKLTGKDKAFKVKNSKVQAGKGESLQVEETAVYK
ncbi:lipase/acyltransferase domain-containing protein [Paenibacillus gansuensis]|uniref:Uncharacterized protein n=1 Tax=Paenibacillus gansuensis TaxID=306542 RepID=A0ABW5PAK1_9BACL